MSLVCPTLSQCFAPPGPQCGFNKHSWEEGAGGWVKDVPRIPSSQPIETEVSMPRSKPDRFTVPHSGEILLQGAQGETQPSFAPLASLSLPLPSLSLHTQPASPSYLTPYCSWNPLTTSPPRPHQFRSIYCHLGTTATASGLSPSSPSPKLAGSKMSLICFTLHTPHGPQDAPPLHYDFQHPSFLLLPFPSANPARAGFIIP